MQADAWTGHPVIQGGMGAGVSHYGLANAVARAGGFGVVSGTALDSILVRRLQDGDPSGDVRAALEHFPGRAVADRIVGSYLHRRAGGPRAPYRPAVFPALAPDGRGGFAFKDPHLADLVVAANFVEVWLAKRGHDCPVGINYLYKIRWPTLPSLYGAMLAGVDVVLMGAGFPAEVPGALAALAASRPCTIPLPVLDGTPRPLAFDPGRVVSACPALVVPAFVGIVSNHLGVKALPAADGYVLEGHEAGGHNAPPRSKEVSPDGEPVYGGKDEVNFDLLHMLLAQNAVRRGRPVQPFWLAGGYAGGLAAARRRGARGVQVGTPFAFCRESGIAPALKRQILVEIMAGGRPVTSATASPSGFPFKVFRSPGTLGDPAVYAARRRACTLGYLFEVADAEGATRCPAEAVENFVAKGGTAADAAGRMCLCNGLLATIGLGAPGEPPLVTAGADLAPVRALVGRHGLDYTAAQVMAYIVERAGTVAPASA